MGFTYSTAADIKKRFISELNRYAGEEGLSAISDKTRREEWTFLNDSIAQAIALKEDESAFPASEVITAVVLLLQGQMTSPWQDKETTDTYKAFDAIIGKSKENQMEAQDKLLCLERFHQFYRNHIIDKENGKFRDNSFVRNQKSSFLASISLRALEEFTECTLSDRLEILQESIKNAKEAWAEVSQAKESKKKFPNAPFKKKFCELLALYSDNKGLLGISDKVRQNEWTFLKKLIDSALYLESNDPSNYSAESVIAAGLMVLKGQLTSPWKAPEDTRTYRAFEEFSKKFQLETSVDAGNALERLELFYSFYEKFIVHADARSLRVNYFTRGQQPDFLQEVCAWAFKALGEQTYKAESAVLEQREPVVRDWGLSTIFGVFGGNSTGKDTKPGPIVEDYCSEEYTG